MTKTDPPSGLRILIVEDEALIAEELQDRLTRLGFAIVAVADTSEKAIDAAEQHRPDLVLMDIRLRGPGDPRTVLRRPVTSVSICKSRWFT